VVEETWRWRDGTIFWQGNSSGGPVDGLYSNWVGTEPNEGLGQGSEDCLALEAGATWNDAPCNQARHFVCQRDLPP
jgi:hypothetical protein